MSSLSKYVGESNREQMMHSLDFLQWICHQIALDAGWWTDLKTGEPKDRNDGELMMLMVSEIAEAMEGARKNKMDEHLPNRKSQEVELADCIIRIMDYAEARKLDIGGAILEKLAYNITREDHKIEHRQGASGKKF